MLYIYIYISYLSYFLIYISIYLSICLSVYLSICLSVYLSICLSVYLSICLSVYLSICLSVYLSIYLSTYLPIYLSTYLSIYRSIDLSIYRSIDLYLSIYLYFLYTCMCVTLDQPANDIFLAPNLLPPQPALHRPDSAPSPWPWRIEDHRSWSLEWKTARKRWKPLDIMVISWFLMGYYGGLMGFNGIYPLVI